MNYDHEQILALDNALLALATTAPRMASPEDVLRLHSITKHPVDPLGFRDKIVAGTKTEPLRDQGTPMIVHLAMADERMRGLKDMDAPHRFFDNALPTYFRHSKGDISVVGIGDSMQTPMHEGRIQKPIAMDMLVSQHAYRQMAIRALEMLADPDRAYPVLGLGQEAYRAALKDPQSDVSKMMQSITANAQFIKGDAELAALVSDSRIAGNFEFGDRLQAIADFLPDTTPPLPPQRMHRRVTTSAPGSGNIRV